MTIRLNGEPHEIAGPVTISALLAELNVDPRRVAVEHNLVIVKRDRYDSVMVGDGDEIEIVNFVGGGSLTMVSTPIPNSQLPRVSDASNASYVNRSSRHCR